MKKIFLLLILAMTLACQDDRQPERIEVRLDNDTFNPVLEPGVKGKVIVIGHYPGGNEKEIDLSGVTLTAKTKRTSGPVDVITLENDYIIPGEGGLGEITAVYQQGGRTWTDTKQIVVRPYYRDYHQTLVLKLFMAYDGNPVEDISNISDYNTDLSRICTFREALDVIKRVDNLTREIPKIIYLVGWQRGGHDHLYPDWSIVNENLKREEDATALESLRWLIREARAYNTTISLHINMVDAFKESPLWEEYWEKDIIAKDENGKLLPLWAVMDGHEAFHLSYTKEWEAGLSQRRIDALIDMIPELYEGHTIHIDAFLAYWEPEQRPLSPWHAKKENGGIDMYEEVRAQRKIFKYWREKGFDVTGEGIFWAHPPGEGFIGLQPMSWWYPADTNFQMEVPERLSSRGRVSRVDQGDCRFASSMQGEEIFLKNKETLPDFLTQFCTMTLPWYYLSRLERVAFVDDQLFYSDGVKAGKEGDKFIIRKGDFILRENDNLFVPALWNEQEIIAYSGEGYTDKSWLLPDEWKGIKQVDIYSITLDGIKQKEQGVPVRKGRISLSLEKEEGVSVFPAGYIKQ